MSQHKKKLLLLYSLAERFRRVFCISCLVMITDESKMLNIFPLAVFTFRIVIQPDLAKDLTLRSSVRFPSKDSAS